MNNIEQELKLKLDEREYNLLCSQTDVPALLHTNVYFGYPDMPKNLLVRIRQKGSLFILCYKWRRSDSDGIMVCDEKEIPISYEYAMNLQKNGIPYAELNKLFSADVKENMYYLGSLRTYRTKFQLEEWTLELDKNEYLGITDYELECENDDFNSLLRLKSYLNYAFGITAVNSAPKIQRFLIALKNSK